MKRVRPSSAIGSSVLEAGVAILALSAFLTAIAGVVDVMGKSFRLTRLVDWVMTDQGVRPLNLQNDADSSVTAVTVNHVRMREYLGVLRQKVSDGLAGQSFGLDARYAVLHIDEHTGHSLTLDDSADYRISGGSGGLPSDLSSCPDLSQTFNELAQRRRIDGDSEVSEFAIPNGVGRGYLGQVVLVGTRLYQDLGGTFTGMVLAQLGYPPGVFGCKTAVLRGDFE